MRAYALTSPAPSDISGSGARGVASGAFLARVCARERVREREEDSSSFRLVARYPRVSARYRAIPSDLIRFKHRRIVGATDVVVLPPASRNVQAVDRGRRNKNGEHTVNEFPWRRVHRRGSPVTHAMRNMFETFDSCSRRLRGVESSARTNL